MDAPAKERARLAVGYLAHGALVQRLRNHNGIVMPARRRAPRRAIRGNGFTHAHRGSRGARGGIRTRLSKPCAVRFVCHKYVRCACGGVLR